MSWSARPNVTPLGHIDNKETAYLLIVSSAKVQKNQIKCSIIYSFPNSLCNIPQFLVFQGVFPFS